MRRPPKADPSRVCLGAISGAHGVRGAVTIKPFTETPEGVAAYGPVETEDGARSFEIRITGQAKAGIVAKLDGINTREQAHALKGTRLYVPRDRLPPAEEDEFYIADLIGLKVVDQTGAGLGEVVQVADFGAGDVMEVALSGQETGKKRPTVFIPFTLDAVPNVDLAAGIVTVDPPDGLLDDGSDEQNNVLEEKS